MGNSSIDLQSRDTEIWKEDNGRLPKVGKGATPVLSGADGIRALACLAVILHHASQKLLTEALPFPAKEMQSFLLLGNSGVSVFFVLSGFLLAYPFWKQYFNGGEFPSIKQYVLRRAARIIPGYYASFLVCTLIILLFQIPSEYFWTRLATGLTFTAGFHYITFFPNEINGPFWSISFEVFCYFLMPMFMFLMFRFISKKRSFLKAFVFWIGVAAIIAFVNKLIHIYLTPEDIQKGWQFGMIGGAKYWMPNYNPVGFFGHFTIGIMASAVTARLFIGSSRIEKFRKAGGFDFFSAFGFIGAIVLLWSVRHAPDFALSFQSQPYYFPAYTLLIGIILATAPHSNWAGKLLDNPFFRYTAKISFGLYIWHYLVMSVTEIVILKGYANWSMTNLTAWVLDTLVVLAVSYIIASLSFRFIEKPVLDRVHKRTRT
jgi:peptidoglycan/LPS O-acetylase OafA/YrhL